MPIFSRLKALFPTAGFPHEDYLTEIVAAAIERQPQTFLAWLQALGATKLDESVKVFVGTQQHCPRSEDLQTPEKYPDFFIRICGSNREEILFIESKVGSGLSGEDQLQIYARILSGYAASRRTLLFITRDYFPQDPTLVLSQVPASANKLNFIQARWSGFASHFRRCTTRPADPIITELLEYMKKEQLTQDHQFMPADVAAIASFPHAYSVMRSVISDELRARLSAVCGYLMDDYDTDVQVIRSPMLTLRNRLKGRNIGVNLGFWLEPGDDGYPVVFGDISFDTRARKKEEIVKALLEFADKKAGRWQAENVSVNSPWGRVVCERSLASFLGELDHVQAIKKFLLDLIEDIAEFKSSYRLPWTRE